MRSQVGGRRHHQERLRRAHRHGNHVGRHLLAEADARVKTVAHDIDHAVIGNQFHLHARIAGHKTAQHGRQQQPRGRTGHVQAQLACRHILQGAQVQQGIIDFAHGRRQARQQLLPRLGRRDAARGAVQQAHAQALFQRAQRMAQGRGGHAPFEGRLAKAAQAGDGGKGRQFIQVSHDGGKRLMSHIQ